MHIDVHSTGSDVIYDIQKACVSMDFVSVSSGSVAKSLLIHFTATNLSDPSLPDDCMKGSVSAVLMLPCIQVLDHVHRYPAFPLL